jgi:NAD(P)-dependent dehydrogenase (short-subunit alcohol dehydrogenase family)
MNLELDGRNVLITGGSKGIGFACAKAFLGESANVAITSRSDRNLADARAKLGKLVTIGADLTDAAAAQAMVAQAERQLGAIHILVNCAGSAERTVPDALTPGAWRAAMDAKYFTYINVIDPVIKHMAARTEGVIVNVVGQGGKVASPTHLPGGAANAALMLVTVGLAHVYAGRGVRVLAINPGMTNTSRVAEGMKAEASLRGISEAEAFRQSLGRLAIGRLAEPEEVAALVVFGASARASYLTGVVIAMDGATSPIVI